jgi:hypothetical protein
MKLQELGTPEKAAKISKVFESYFGSRLEIERLPVVHAKTLLKKVRGLISEHKNTTARHHSERDPSYLQLIMMEQALRHHVKENTPPVQTTQPNTGSGTVTVDPKLKMAQDKLKKGQTLSTDEQKLINATAAAMQESRLRRALRTLKESEVQQAQVVLAAQDMVDSMQGMIEDATEMQYKELPALVDSIRNQVGMDQATQFNADVTAALSTLVQSLQGAKQQMDTALGVVTGQGAPAPALDAAMAAGDAGVDAGMPAPADDEMALDTEVDAEVPDLEEPAGSDASLGRERR